MTDNFLVWLDLEATGLDPGRERILELAVIITDGELDLVVEGPELVVHQSDDLLGAMDAWCVEHHGQTGLTEKARASTISEADAEAQIIAFIDAHIDQRVRPVLAGNSIHFDRRFILQYLPLLDRRLHYRMVDVSTVKELGRRWYPGLVEQHQPKQARHRALDDIRESIEELRFYRQRLFVAP